MFQHKKQIETQFQCPELTNKLLKLGGKAFETKNFGSKISKNHTGIEENANPKSTKK